jgi:DNA (cytosine-5)-methyltransferase 1
MVMKYFSMFSGIGGFELGIKKSNVDMECVGFSEIDKYAIQIYQKHFGGHKSYGNCSKIEWGNVAEFDLLVGGFPCQAFSIAGKRGGFDDTRGTLFFEIARCLKEKRPRYFLLENVKGLLSHDSGNTFKTIITTLTELGYCVEWQVLNSKNFGVPQNRERVFIVGYLGEFCGRTVFPIGTECETVDGIHTEEQGEGQRIPSEVPRTNGNNECAKGWGDGSQRFIEESQRLADAQRVRTTDGCSSTLKGLGGGHGAKTGLYAIPCITPDRLEKRQNGRRFKEDGDDMFTLTGQDIHGVATKSEGQLDFRVRRLTPTECERLQGFPDGWTAYGINGKVSDTQRYKCLGNAVTVNVIDYLIRRMYNVLFK